MTAPGTLIAAALLIAQAGPSVGAAADLRTRGLELSFNLDHAAAVEMFRLAIRADPDNLAGYRLLTAALWADALFQNGAITADDFTGETRAAFQSRTATRDLEHAAEHGLRMLDADSRPRAFGEVGRWRFAYGLSLAALNQTDSAAAQFTAVLQGESLEWVRHHTRLELNKLASSRMR